MYSTVEIANHWRKQWPGEFFFSHGSNHSCGVAILVHKLLDFKLISSRVDNEGRYLILEAINQDTPFVVINIYAPNKTSNHPHSSRLYLNLFPLRNSGSPIISL